MADEQLEWVFDSLVEFLRGPIWNIPVLTFIEQKSVVFEPGAENEEELTKIHDAYKNLVDFMLGSYMEDLKISPEEFEKSCSVASKKALNQFHQSLFQQVWAADDFEIFRRMMTQKNLELQLQALEFLTQKRGSVPDCMEPTGKIKDEKEMEEIIKKVIEESDSEIKLITQTDTALQEKMTLEAEKEKELLEEAMKQSVKVQLPVDSPEEIAKEAETPEPTETEDNANEQSNDDNAKETNDAKDTDSDKNHCETLIDKTVEIIQDAGAPELKSAESNESEPFAECANGVSEISISNSTVTDTPKALPPLRTPDERPWSEGDSTIYTHAQVEVSPLDLEKRQNYLRQQRDRILAMKKLERARRLSTSEEVITQSRPKSAKAARKVLREESTEIDPQTLAFRKTLAAKLRCEVIDKSD